MTKLLKMKVNSQVEHIHRLTNMGEVKEVKKNDQRELLLHKKMEI